MLRVYCKRLPTAMATLDTGRGEKTRDASSAASSRVSDDVPTASTVDDDVPTASTVDDDVPTVSTVDDDVPVASTVAKVSEYRLESWYLRRVSKLRSVHVKGNLE